MKVIRVILIGIIFILLPVIANTTIINVPADQPTVQQGIDVSVNSDTVLVQPGTYFENINYNGKNIVVASLFLTTQDTTYIYQTVIDGNSSGSVVTFENGEVSTTVLCGFTITNGMMTSTMGGGGGITCWNNTNPNLYNLIIIENYAHYGGGIYCSNSSPLIHDLTIINNAAPGIGGGGGIYLCDNSSPDIENVIIKENYSNHVGGGIYCYSSNPSLINVTISENFADKGGGIYCVNSNLLLTNALIENNTASGGLGSEGGGIFCDASNPIITSATISENTTWGSGGGICCFNNSNPILLNCILWNDSTQEISFYEFGSTNTITISYSDIQGGEAGIVVTNNNGTVNWLEGNIDANPLFACPQNGDFHLTWANFPIPDSTMSPCIDAGDPASPLDPDGTIADMGAFYFDQTIVSIDDNPDNNVSTEIFQNYPNPFSTLTTISFNLATKSHKNTQIKIYNVKGELVKQLSIPNSIGNNSKSSIIWDGKDENGKQMSSGIYLYKLIIDNEVIATKKCLLLK